MTVTLSKVMLPRMIDHGLMIRSFFGFVSGLSILLTVFLVQGDEAKDDDHGLALHLPHLEHLHLSQGQLLKFQYHTCELLKFC